MLPDDSAFKGRESILTWSSSCWILRSLEVTCMRRLSINLFCSSITAAASGGLEWPPLPFSPVPLEVAFGLNFVLKLFTEEWPKGKALEEWVRGGSGSTSEESDSPTGPGESIHFLWTSWNFDPKLFPLFRCWLELLLPFLFGCSLSLEMDTGGSGLCKNDDEYGICFYILAL